jgi:hypothetical protein
MPQKPTMMDVTRVIEHTMCEMTVKGFMRFSLDGADFDKLVEFEFAGCVIVAVDRLVCADSLVDVHAVDEAIAHFDGAELCFSHADSFGWTRNETAGKPHACTATKEWGQLVPVEIIEKKQKHATEQ